MANYNKSFNFRNGVQVDEDKFLVRNNLVGIGTTVPTADLDVRGTLKSIGIITASNLVVTGVATFTSVKIGTGITIDGNAGIISAKFFGDGAGLFNIPTSQWVDVDPAVFPGVGVGYSSIYAAGTVGIGTTVPRSFLQVGGDPNLGQNGVGVNSTGDIRASGIITASSFVGSGASLTTLNASNISSGTLDNSRLPSNISVGFVTATTFSGSLTGTATTAQGLTGTPNITVGTIDGSSLNISGLSTFAGITTVTGTTLFSKQLNISGIATVRQLSDYKALVGAASSTTETFVVTVASKTANHRYFGTGSASGYYIDDKESPFITLLPGKTYRFDQANASNATHQLRFYLEADKTTQYTTNVTFNGTAGSAGAYTEIIVTDTTPIVLHYQCVNHGYMGNSVQTNSNFINTPYSINTLGGLSVSGISTFAGITTVTGPTLFVKQLNVSGVATVGILTATQATIGVLTSTSSKSGSIQLGVTATNQVDTTSGNLVLDSAGGLVDINDNIDVSGTSTLSGEVTVDTGIVPDTSTGAYLGQNTRQFSEAWIGDLKIAVGVGNSNKIETISQELVLDSVVNKVTVDANLSVAGVSTFTGNLTLGAGIEPASDLGTTLGTASKRFSSSQIGGIRVGVAQTFEIDTVSGTELVLNSSAGTTRINDDVFISGIGSFGGEVTVDIGIIPDVDKGSYLGTSGKSFSEAFIDEVRIGVGATNKIDTREGALLLDAANNLVNVENNLVVSGISTLTGNVSVGSNNEFIVNTSTGRVGIGTNVLTRPFQVKSITDLIVELRTDTSDVTIGIGRSAVGAGQSVGKLTYSNNILNFTNEDLGGLEFISHSGSSGINTGNFKWIYGQNNSELMSLTYDGKLGLGITNPSNTFHVVGTSTITGNAFFGGNVTIAGNLIGGSISLPSTITSNISTTTGSSTFRSVNIGTSIQLNSGATLLLGSTPADVSTTRIGIGTTNPITGIDARNSTAFFNAVGLGTTTRGTVAIEPSNFVFSGDLVGVYGSKIGIGTTAVSTDHTTSLYGDIMLCIAPGATNNRADIRETQINIDSRSTLFVGPYAPYETAPSRARAVVDFGSAVGAGVTNHQYMLPPIISTGTRNGIGGTVAGAIIYNSTTNKHQGYDGTTWNDLY